jgi:hypothetical protein
MADGDQKYRRARLHSPRSVNVIARSRLSAIHPNQLYLEVEFSWRGHILSCQYQTLCEKEKGTLEMHDNVEIHKNTIMSRMLFSRDPPCGLSNSPVAPCVFLQAGHRVDGVLRVCMRIRNPAEV